MNAFPVPSSQTHLSHPKYRPDIDGLRAVAVLSVIGFHAFPGLFPGGFIGVDIFFVISGFLISSIIFENLDKQTFSFTEFYVRRIRRIFPALILVMSACVAVGWFVLLPDEYGQLAKHTMAAAGFISNFFFWQEAGYFDNAAETKPLLHLWSLGIEEQFYIFWPLLVYLAWKRRWAFALMLGGMFAVSFAANVRLSHSDSVQAFYSPIPRFWELLMGSMLAYFTFQKSNRWSKVQAFFNYTGDRSRFGQGGKSFQEARSVGGVVLISVAVLMVNKQVAFPGWWVLLPVLGAYLLISAGQHAWLNRVLFTNRAMVWTGIISYPLYLWHWPLLSFARIMESKTPSVAIRLMAIAMALILAWITYRIVEHPARYGKKGIKKALVLSLLMMFVAGMGCFAYTQDGLKRRIPDEVLRQAEALRKDKLGDIWPPCRSGSGKSHGCRIMNPGLAPDVALLGDSHALQMVYAMDEIYRTMGKNVVLLAAPGCFPFLGIASACSEFMGNSLRAVLAAPTIKTVILAHYTSFIFHGRYWAPHPDNHAAPDMNTVVENYRKALHATLIALTQAGKQVIFIVDPPDLYFEPEECVAFRPVYLPGHKFRASCSVGRSEFDRWTSDYHRIIEGARAEFPSVRFINAFDYFCDEQDCHALIDGELLYRDNNHLNEAGARYFARKAIRQFLP